MNYDIFECQYLYLLLRRLAKDRIISLTLTMVVIIFKSIAPHIPSYCILVFYIPRVDPWLKNHDLWLLLSIFLQAFLYSKLYRVEYWLTNDSIPSLFFTMIDLSFHRFDLYTFFSFTSN